MWEIKCVNTREVVKRVPEEQRTAAIRAADSGCPCGGTHYAALLRAGHTLEATAHGEDLSRERESNNEGDNNGGAA